MSQGLRGSPQGAGFSLLNGRLLGGFEHLRQVEAKYPALLFKQQLTAFLEKIYGLTRELEKRDCPSAWTVYSDNCDSMLFYHF
ncbi:hypothetical protein SLA2020_232240 [Shorea laevis]